MTKLDLAYYSEQVDRILGDTVGTQSFTQADFEVIVEHTSRTIHMFNQDLDLADLKAVVSTLVQHKCRQFYMYDAPAPTPAKVPKTTKTSTKIPKNREPSEDSSEISLMVVSEMETSEDASESECDVKVVLASAADLVSHRYDYEHSQYTDSNHKRRYKRVKAIKKIPQFAQKSPEWIEQRKQCLTATAIAVVIDEDPYNYPIDMLMDKCDRGKPFDAFKNAHHGNKYEEIANMFYGFRNNVRVAEYGMIQHPTNKYIGASPDGICDRYTMDDVTLTTLVGRLLEIKCPITRKIKTEGKVDGDICPHYYYVQVQTQLYVMQLDECDFLQCEIEEYDSWAAYLKDTHSSLPGFSAKTNLERGCVIQLSRKDMLMGDPDMCVYQSQYIYPPRLHMSPSEIQEWIATEVHDYSNHKFAAEHVIDRIIYWRLVKVSCSLIKAEREWFESKVPLLKQFWTYVEFYRENTKQLDALIEFAADIKHENSDLIFKRVHSDYKAAYPSTKLTPLYQEPTPWRLIYKKKAEAWRKYEQFKKSRSAYQKKQT